MKFKKIKENYENGCINLCCKAEGLSAKLKQKKGATILEYGLVLGFVAVLIPLLYNLFQKIGGKITEVTNSIK